MKARCTSTDRRMPDLLVNQSSLISELQSSQRPSSEEVSSTLKGMTWVCLITPRIPMLLLFSWYYHASPGFSKCLLLFLYSPPSLFFCFPFFIFSPPPFQFLKTEYEFSRTVLLTNVFCVLVFLLIYLIKEEIHF